MTCTVIRIRHPIAPVVVVRIRFTVLRAALFADRPAYTGGSDEVVRLQEEIRVAIVTARCMPAFAAILVVHLMLGDGTVIMIALFAVRLVIAVARPPIVMSIRGLRIAFADTLAGVVVHIRPGVGVGCGFRHAAAVPLTGAGMVFTVPVVLPEVPIVTQCGACNR